MPTIVYKGDGKQFTLRGGCLAIMGRYTSGIDNVSYLMRRCEMETVRTVEFKDILALLPTEKNLKYLKVMNAYMSMFPFMRCISSTPSRILTTTHCSFNAVDYSQNEIMHAMFHLRQLAYAKLSAFGSKYMIEVLYDLTEKGVPFWKAYTLCMIPTHIDPRCPITVIDKVIEADANTFNLRRIPVGRFKQLISGRKPVPEYRGGTITQNIKRLRTYPQNMSDYLSGNLLGRPSMADFLRELILHAQTGGNASAIADAFGHPIIIDGAQYDVKVSDLLKALDRTLHKYGITGKGKIKC